MNVDRLRDLLAEQPSHYEVVVSVPLPEVHVFDVPHTGETTPAPLHQEWGLLTPDTDLVDVAGTDLTGSPPVVTIVLTADQRDAVAIDATWYDEQRALAIELAMQPVREVLDGWRDAVADPRLHSMTIPLSSAIERLDDALALSEARDD